MKRYLKYMKRYRKVQRIKKKKPIFKSPFLWLSILFLVLFGGIFYLVCFADFFQIQEIVISGNQTIPSEVLKNLIENQLTRDLLFFQTKSIFLVDLKKIDHLTLEKFSQISKVNLIRKIPNILEVKVKEREAIANLCQNGNCLPLDKEGIVFQSEINENLIQLRKKDLSPEVKLGQKIIAENLVSQILKIESQLRDNFKILTNEILIVSGRRTNFKTSEGWEIYFNPQRDILWQLTKLRAVLEKEIPAERQRDLAYIDLRFGNLAPYKYRHSD